MNQNDPNILNLKTFPGFWGTILMGFILSIVIALVTVGCYGLSAMFIIRPIAYPNTNKPWNVEWDLSLVGQFLILFSYALLIIGYYSFIPVIIAGGTIALTLRKLTIDGSLNTTKTIVLGALVGFSTGCAIAVFFMNRISAPEFTPRVDPYWIGLMGAFVGILHSWILRGCMRRRS